MKFSEALKDYLEQREKIKHLRSEREIRIEETMLEYYAEVLDRVMWKDE